MLNCATCESYNKGKGSKACKYCNEFKDIMPRSAPCVDYSPLPSEIIENMSLPHMKDYYGALEPEEAILMFRKFHLEQTEKEMAKAYNITRQAVAKRIKNVLNILGTYANS